ncbi:MAG: hypothetical protein J7J98_07590 [candidate division Zixibacteria bacterium]|nr:hypothetical protein [candidate division Zixibacteria bacterium]
MSRQMKHSQSRESDSTLDSGLFKFCTKLGLSLVVMLLALTLMQCTVKKPEAPTWNTQLTVPLISRTYTMSEIIDKIDQDGITIDVDSAITFSVSEDIDTVTLDAENLSTDDMSYLAVQQLGLIDLPAPVIAPVILDILMIGGLATFLPGEVPATSFNINSELPFFTEFTSVGLETGGAWIKVANNLGFAITTDSVILWDAGYNRSIGRQGFPPPIPDGGIDSLFFDLSGQTISNQIEARILASTMGGIVLSTSGKNLTTTFSFDGDLTVGAATAEIPEQIYDFLRTVTLSESDAIHRATLTSGTLQLDIGNQTNMTATLDITFPDLVYDSNPVTIQRTIDPISSSSITLDLTGYELTPVDSTVPQDINIEITATIPGSAPQHVAVNQTDQFIVNASLTNLAFESVTGVFSAVTTSFAPTQHDIEVPEGFDSISFASAILTLNIDNAIEMPGNLNVELLGNNGKSLTISGIVNPGTASASVVTSFIDTTVADFLSPVPSQITVSGSAGFGDGVSEGSIRASDYITASIDIIAPMDLIIGQAIIEPDIEGEEIDQEDIDAITDHVIEARLIYNVINRLPLGATVNLYLSGDSATVISNPEVSFVDDIFVLGAPTTAGITSDTISTGYQTVVIDSTDIHVLENDTLYIATQIMLEDTEGQSVKLVTSDYIQIIGRIEVDYRFTGDF